MEITKVDIAGRLSGPFCLRIIKPVFDRQAALGGLGREGAIAKPVVGMIDIDNVAYLV